MQDEADKADMVGCEARAHKQRGYMHTTTWLLKASTKIMSNYLQRRNQMLHQKYSWIVSVFQVAVVDYSIMIWPADCYIPWLGISPESR